MCLLSLILYQVAATFITDEEDSEAISAGIDVVRKWNPKWTPSTWMTDNCQAEINAIEACFPGLTFSVNCAEY